MWSISQDNLLEFFQDCQWHKSQEKQGKEVVEIKKVKKKDTKCIA